MPLNRRDHLIVFDIGNVLLKFDPALAVKNFDRHDPGKGKAMAEALWSPPLMHRFETGKMSGVEVFERLRRRFELRMSFAGFRRAFTGIFTPILENLRLFSRFSRERPTALLSNVNEIHWVHIHRRYPVLRRAHHPCGSHELGVMKPSPRAFKAVADRAGVVLHKMVYVDDRAEFISAARRLGIVSLHYTGHRPLADLFADAGVS